MLVTAAIVSSNTQGVVLYAADTVTEETAPATVKEEALHYVYVESPYLEAPATQNIVVSWGDGTETIQDMCITVVRDDGVQEEWANSKREENAYLFSKEFPNAEEKHTYEVLNVKYAANGKEEILQLSELNAAVEFGVNKKYEDYGENVIPLEGDLTLESSIVTIDEDGQMEAKDDIAEALNEVSGGSEQIQKGKSEEVVIALDPGHDNRHGGAVNKAEGLIEQELTLKIANYAKVELEQYPNIRVYMTRTTNACPYPETEITKSGKCIEQRVLAAAKEGARIYVSLHLNSTEGTTSANGAEVIFPNGNWKEEVGADGKALAQKIQDQLVKLGLTDRGIYSKDTTIDERYPDGSLSDYFSVQIYNKEQGIPGIIVEHAFLSNANDVNKFLKTEEGLQSLGKADAEGIVEFLQLTKSKWEYVEGKGWKYFEKGSYVTSSWKYIDGFWYYFNEEGYRCTGWKEIFGSWFYMDADGKMQTGWQEIGGKTYYFDPNGRMATNQWVKYKDNWYYATANGGMYTNGKYKVGSNEYVFGADGVMQTGVVSVYNSGTKQYSYYLTEDSGAVIKQSGWKFYNLYYYYLDKNGKVCTEQWIDYDYYVDSEGKMVVGTYEIDGFVYYFDNSGYCWYVLNAEDPDSTYTGWDFIDGYWYYYKNGQPYTGWVDNTYYIMDGVMLTNQFLEVMDRSTNKTCYNYLGYDGKKVKNGWYQITVNTGYLMNEWIYADYNGKLVEDGWKWIGGSRYYFKDCMMVTGVVEINGKTEIFDESGRWISGTHKGWVKNFGLWYYFKENGTLLKNVDSYFINGYEFHFWGNGSLRCNEVITDFKTKKMYYLNDGGYKQSFTGWKQVKNTWYYADANGKAVNGLQRIGGVSYFFIEGVMQTGYIEVKEWGGVYFFDASGAYNDVKNGWASDGHNYYYVVNGVPVKNKFYTIGNAVYSFDSQGKMRTGKYNDFLFAESGVLVRNSWCKIAGRWYYGNELGRYVCGQRTIGGTTYWFDEFGRMI